MSKILPIIILLVTIGGAGFAAMTLRGGGEDTTAEAAGGHGDEGEVHEVGGGDHDDGHGGGGAKPGDIGYFKFQRDFIVPVMRNSTVDSLVLLTLSVEMDANELEYVRPREPRLRDAFMMTLMEASHDGLFSGDITEPETYKEIRKRLNETAKLMFDEKAGDVLIIDFARQDQRK